jgi:predicted alpha/beta superfamily hydrolase
MKQLIIAFISLISLSVFSQKTVELFDSKKLGEEREITISLPKSYAKETKRKYPLLVLLDGDYLYAPFQGAITYANYWDDIPELIIVAITQNKNDERYDDCQWDEETGLPLEKGVSFFEFIGTELIPHIEKNYRVAPFKIIAGHDTTAGFSNLYLYKENPLFDAYISLSPDLPAQMDKRLPERIAQLDKPIYYYQSSSDGDIKRLLKGVQSLDDGLKTINKESFNYKFDAFIGASHYSLVLHSIPNALFHIFAVYQPISSIEFQKIATLESGYVQYLIDKYETIEKAFNTKIPIRMSDFKAIEAAIFKNSDWNALDELSIVAEKQYPKSMLHDYYMALMYEKKGLYDKAKKNYLSAMQKEPIGSLNKDMMFDKAEEMKSMPKD